MWLVCHLLRWLMITLPSGPNTASFHLFDTLGKPSGWLPHRWVLVLLLHLVILGRRLWRSIVPFSGLVVIACHWRHKSTLLGHLLVYNLLLWLLLHAHSTSLHHIFLLHPSTCLHHILLMLNSCKWLHHIWWLYSTRCRRLVLHRLLLLSHLLLVHLRSFVDPSIILLRSFLGRSRGILPIPTTFLFATHKWKHCNVFRGNLEAARMAHLDST